jgi:hypothetical protein
MQSVHPNCEISIWIITEAPDDKGERAATTALLPEEYCRA